MTEIFESCENTKETHFENVPDVIDETDLNRIYSLASNQLLPLELRIAFTTVGRFSPGPRTPVFELGQLTYRVSWEIPIFLKLLRQKFRSDFLQAADEIIIHSIPNDNEISSNITDLLDMIPTIATNVISNRFCREYGVQCNGQVWLNNQGQEQRNWPRFGVLTSVKVSPDEKLFNEIWSGLITKCSGITFNTVSHII